MDTPKQPVGERLARLRPRVRLVGVALAVYWAALFVATHVPLPKGMALPVSDKTVHFLAYGGLAALVLALGAARRALNGRFAAVTVAVLALYAACDEALQIPVGRNGDVVDWAADVAGTLLVVGGWLILRLLARGDRPGRGSRADRELHL